MTRLASLVAAAVFLAVAATAALPVQPASAADCDGVWVVVDKTALGGSVQTRCAPGSPSDGLAALAAAGFDYSYVPRQPGLVCQIDGLPDPCNGAPVDAYWGYWHAEAGGSWTYSNRGAGNRTPPAGSVEGWSFGAKVAPSVAPPAPAPEPEPDPEPEPEPETNDGPSDDGAGDGGSGGDGPAEGSGASSGSTSGSADSGGGTGTDGSDPNDAGSDPDGRSGNDADPPANSATPPANDGPEGSAEGPTSDETTDRRDGEAADDGDVRPTTADDAPLPDEEPEVLATRPDPSDAGDDSNGADDEQATAGSTTDEVAIDAPSGGRNGSGGLVVAGGLLAGIAGFGLFQHRRRQDER